MPLRVVISRLTSTIHHPRPDRACCTYLARCMGSRNCRGGTRGRYHIGRRLSETAVRTEGSYPLVCYLLYVISRVPILLHIGSANENQEAIICNPRRPHSRRYDLRGGFASVSGLLGIGDRSPVPFESANLACGLLPGWAILAKDSRWNPRFFMDRALGTNEPLEGVPLHGRAQPGGRPPIYRQ